MTSSWPLPRKVKTKTIPPKRGPTFQGLLFLGVHDLTLVQLVEGHTHPSSRSNRRPNILGEPRGTFGKVDGPEIVWKRVFEMKG
ncbi:hypothetical protein CDAR_105681 [Caerostris darwini]|uniref:Uncharacterized protein n=1 Tax=Caerostris darwini TaxID=1538125 RepID=A0AAV4UZV7_9ARAC|nr:hypothetical protein CDAR_105681 [Caerostris darwini]